MNPLHAMSPEDKKELEAKFENRREDIFMILKDFPPIMRHNLWRDVTERLQSLDSEDKISEKNITDEQLHYSKILQSLEYPLPVTAPQGDDIPSGSSN